MYQRLLAEPIQRLSKQYPAITLTGPRQSGKTTLCQSVFTEHDYANLENVETRQYATQDPKGFLAQFKNGVILDEIQRTPNLPSYIQEIIDASERPGEFILTGSQQFEVTNTINQSLAGRTAILRLLPLAYQELFPKKQSMSLSNLLYTGFYPRIHNKKLNPTEALSFYLATYVERDIRALINIKDLLTFERFLKICATQVGQLTNYSRIANDCGVDQKTVKSWLSILEASYIIYQIAPHSENFRKRLTKSNKLYFYDVGLAAFLLGINNESHIDSHPMKGALFENFIVTEFLKNRFNHVMISNLYFFRDNVGNEVDIILDYSTTLVSVEIKSSSTIQPKTFKGLDYYHKLAGEKNTKRYCVYGGDKSFEREGVHVYSYKDLATLFELLNQ